MESDAVLLIEFDDYLRAVAEGTFIAGIGRLFEEGDLGRVILPPVRVTSRSTGFSTEPDVVAILWETFEKEKVQVSMTHYRTKPMLVIEGCPDLIVEIVNEGPERNLPHVYAPAGIPEVWVADLRDGKHRLEIHALRAGRYELISRDSEDWTRSPILGTSFRLLRRLTRVSTPHFTLECRSI
jgi:Uma2 family endonuclease